jgi:hypothetical protein
MSEKRARLKKGTVIDGRQDENGQWWRTTVVRYAATGFKSVTRKIDAPNREVPQSASQCSLMFSCSRFHGGSRANTIGRSPSEPDGA